jgi:23S rRNA (cytidine1920-2'-O)/16S rRNA (cytidine1409-2'-O)-methyltransferase
LRLDPRVAVMDRTNARTLESLPEAVAIVTIDVSFIGLHLVLPGAVNVLAAGGEIVALIKPQFEAGRADIGRGGVVREPAVHRRVLVSFLQTAEGLGLGVKAMIASPLRGPAGNIEFLVHLIPGSASAPSNELVDNALAEAEQL